MKKILQKNRQIIVCLSLLFLALTSVQMTAQKRVLFICNSNFAPGANASAAQADPFIKYLQADPVNFTVTTITTLDGTTSVQKNGVADPNALRVGGVAGGAVANTNPTTIAAFYADYDLVIPQESFTSANAIWKPTGLLGIKNITIPVIYSKAFALRSTNGTTNLALTDWNAAAPDAAANISATVVLGSKLTITVPPANQSNQLFSGIDFTAGNNIAIFKQLASDAGLTGTKAVDQVYNANITDISTGDLANQKTTLLASIDPSAGPVVGGAVPAVLNPNALMCVNDIPGGTYFGTAGDMLPLSSRMIFFAYNYGAVALGYSDGVTSNVTDDGLKIFKNAALMLTAPSLGVKANTLASENISVSPNPTSGIVTVNSASDVKLITVFDATGKQVSTSKTNTVDLSSQTSGVYLLKVQTENGSATKKVVVE